MSHWEKGMLRGEGEGIYGDGIEGVECRGRETGRVIGKGVSNVKGLAYQHGLLTLEYAWFTFEHTWLTWLTYLGTWLTWLIVYLP